MILVTCILFTQMCERVILMSDDRQALKRLGVQYSLDVLPAQDIKAHPQALSKLPRTVMERYCALPYDVCGDVLCVAMSDPNDLYAREDIRQIAGMQIEIHLCEREYIMRSIELCCDGAAFRSTVGRLDVIGNEDAAVELVDSLISCGYDENASDIHIEPFEEHTLVRMRTDGLVGDYRTLPKELHAKVIARIKIMADLDIAEHRLPQDGNITAQADGNRISLRVSVVPTVYGEKAVLRYLTTNSEIDDAQTFGMSGDNHKKLMKILSSHSGMVYFTGPTGSGKTTTLYMILEMLSALPVNICTIEDPVERRIARVNQTEVNNVAGVDFANGLRALLRQDPDIVMIGETRDLQTAEISVRAAITGHLVLSTLHTTDAASAVIRLRDMGIAPYLAANALSGIVAQRLLRKVCTECSQEILPTAEEREIIGHESRYIRRGKGCPHCKFTGYRGRIAVHEVLYIDKTLRRMIAEGESSDTLHDYAVRQQGMKPLRALAVELVNRGVTTPEELLRASLYED